MRTITVQTGTGPIELPSEETASPHLFLTPAIHWDPNRGAHVLAGGTHITHGPTGTWLPSGWLDTHEQREVCEQLAQLDWSSPDPHRYTGDRGADLRAAWTDAVQAAELLPPPPGEPAQDEENGRLAKTAAGTVRSHLDRFQRSWDRLHGDPTAAERIPADGDDGKPNPWWLLELHGQVHDFVAAYLLAALQRTAPDVADSAAHWLADQLEAGDSLGEWVYSWRLALEQGEPLELPGVPTPATASGSDLFGAHPVNTPAVRQAIAWRIRPAVAEALEDIDPDDDVLRKLTDTITAYAAGAVYVVLDLAAAGEPLPATNDTSSQVTTTEPGNQPITVGET